MFISRPADKNKPQLLGLLFYLLIVVISGAQSSNEEERRGAREARPLDLYYGHIATERQALAGTIGPGRVKNNKNATWI